MQKNDSVKALKAIIKKQKSDKRKILFIPTIAALEMFIGVFCILGVILRHDVSTIQIVGMFGVLLIVFGATIITGLVNVSGDLGDLSKLISEYPIENRESQINYSELQKDLLSKEKTKEDAINSWISREIEITTPQDMPDDIKKITERKW